jgi:hypothetical protein
MFLRELIGCIHAVENIQKASPQQPDLCNIIPEELYRRWIPAFAGRDDVRGGVITPTTWSMQHTPEGMTEKAQRNDVLEIFSEH